MLREFCQVTDFRSRCCRQDDLMQITCHWQFLTDGLASGRFSVLLSVRKYFFPLSGTKRFVKYNVSDGNTF